MISKFFRIFEWFWTLTNFEHLNPYIFKKRFFWIQFQFKCIRFFSGTLHYYRPCREREQQSIARRCSSEIDFALKAQEEHALLYAFWNKASRMFYHYHVVDYGYHHSEVGSSEDFWRKPYQVLPIDLIILVPGLQSISFASLIGCSALLSSLIQSSLSPEPYLNEGLIGCHYEAPAGWLPGDGFMLGVSFGRPGKVEAVAYKLRSNATTPWLRVLIAFVC